MFSSYHQHNYRKGGSRVLYFTRGMIMWLLHVFSPHGSLYLWPHSLDFISKLESAFITLLAYLTLQIAVDDRQLG
jgi:hypothetical protein